jgi:hypothetical protein
MFFATLGTAYSESGRPPARKDSKIGSMPCLPNGDLHKNNPLLQL